MIEMRRKYKHILKAISHQPNSSTKRWQMMKYIADNNALGMSYTGCKEIISDNFTARSFATQEYRIANDYPSSTWLPKAITMLSRYTSRSQKIFQQKLYIKTFICPNKQYKTFLFKLAKRIEHHPE